MKLGTGHSFFKVDSTTKDPPLPKETPKNQCVQARAQFHGSAYCKQRIGTCGSREFCAYIKRVSQVTSEFWLLPVIGANLVYTRHSTLTK